MRRPRAERVYVTGCGANLERAFSDMPANVTVIAERSEQTPAAVAADAGVLGCTVADHRRERVRAFLKIQDGCSFGCSFCLVPQVRGPSRSRALCDVVVEARRRAREGYREIVLSGINLGCYRDREAGCDLAGLLRQLAKIHGLDRIRLSSIEVNHLTDELIETMRALPNVAPHLHVPLQSGDDAVLHDMARRYDAATFVERVGRARGMNITTDVIVGFPSEDECAFERSLETVSRIGATKVHVFPVLTAAGNQDGDPPIRCRNPSSASAAADCVSGVPSWHSSAGVRSSARMRRFLLIGPVAATPLTTRPGSSRRPLAHSSVSVRSV